MATGPTDEDRLLTQLRQARQAHAFTTAALHDADRAQTLLVVLLERIVTEFRAGQLSAEAITAAEEALTELGAA